MTPEIRMAASAWSLMSLFHHALDGLTDVTTQKPLPLLLKRTWPLLVALQFRPD